jgi:hypothetical protein
MADVQQHGSQAVPPHLLNASHARMRSHGIGVGYRYPHDYEGADVEQQYLPDLLAGKRYYQPTDQGMERQIADRLERLRLGREDTRASGGPTKSRERGPQVDSMKVAGRVMRDRQAGAKASGPAVKGGPTDDPG